MSNRTRKIGSFWLLTAMLAWPMAANAQVPVDADGKPVGPVEITPGAEIEEFQGLSASELQELIGPIALYPDDLLAIILPASTYPLQIVQAARFLEDLEKDSSLKPDEDWDDSVVALTNYPEVVEIMSEDLDWTWRLGEAVVAQQTDVITAIETFRDRAYAAGNLKSDDFQYVTEADGAIHITPVEEDVIYVPYYEPERVVVYQPRPVYYYYPRSYPVYYYPYPAGHGFDYGYFWGVTTAYSIGWYSNHLRVWHHSYNGHPYYGHSYWNNWWYRRPDIHVHNNYYGYNDNHNYSYDRYRRGDYWQPQTRRTVRSSDQRLTRTRYYPNSNTQSTSTTGSLARSASSSGIDRDKNAHRNQPRDRPSEPQPDFEFRDREGTATSNRTSHTVKPSTVRTSSDLQRSISTASRAQRSSARTSVPKQSTSRPSEPKQTYSRPSQPTQSNVRTSQPKQSYSRPSQPKQSTSRPSQPRQSTSRPSQPRQSSSRPSPSKQSSSAPSKSRSSNSGSSKSSHRSSSRNSSRKD